MSLLAELAAELGIPPDQLHARLTADSDEALSPNYLSATSDGKVGASFSGHISAAGLDLELGDSLTPPDDDKVRWLRASDGKVGAEDTASEYVGGSLFKRIKVLDPDDPTNTSVELDLTIDGANAKSYIDLILNYAGTSWSARLLSTDRNSGFIQNGSANGARLIWGTNVVSFVAASEATTLVSLPIGYHLKNVQWAAVCPILTPGQFLFHSTNTWNVGNFKAQFETENGIAITQDFDFAWIAVIDP